MNTSRVFLLSILSFTMVNAADNIFSRPLAVCSNDPLTGWYRDGTCKTGYFDYGTHVVCAKVTKEFLEFSKSRGNDLITPSRRYRFPGLKPDDYWCLCALRWREANQAGKAPRINLEATHKKALKYIPLPTLQMFNVKE